MTFDQLITIFPLNNCEFSTINILNELKSVIIFPNFKFIEIIFSKPEVVQSEFDRGEI
jgi:hypothetical protein